MKEAATSSALSTVFGACSWFPPFAIGLLVGGTVVHIYMQWKELNDAIEAIEALGEMAQQQQDQQFIDAEWREAPA